MIAEHPDRKSFILDFKLNISQLADVLGNISLVDYQNNAVIEFIRNHERFQKTQTGGIILEAELPVELFNYTKTIEIKYGVKIIKKSRWLIFSKFYVEIPLDSTTFKLTDNFIDALIVDGFIKNTITENPTYVMFNGCNLVDLIIIDDIIESAKSSINQINVFNNFMMLATYYQNKLQSNINKCIDHLNGFDVNGYLQDYPNHFWIIYLLINHVNNNGLIFSQDIVHEGLVSYFFNDAKAQYNISIS
jgi:hypothetical protein